MHNNGKAVPYNWILGFLVSIFTVFGFELEIFKGVLLKNPLTYLAIIIIGLCAGFLIEKSWILLSKKGAHDVLTGRFQDPEAYTKPGLKAFLSSAGIIFVGHFIVLLACFPGFFVYDAQDELIQTVLRSYNTQHPLLHVLGMGGVIQLVHKITGSYNLAIFTFIFFGMLLNVVVYAYLVYYLRSFGLRSRGAVLISLYFALFPVLVMYSLCSSKDGVFGCMLLLVFLHLKEALECPDVFFASPKKAMNMAVASCAMMLFRNNGVYAYCIFIVFLAAYIRKDLRLRRYIARFIMPCIMAVIAYFMITASLTFATKAHDVGHKEILTVPIMQLARVYEYSPEKLPAGAYEKIEYYINKDNLDYYEPKSSDAVKAGFNEENFLEDELGFFKLWAQVGIRNINEYIDAALSTSYELWYPWTVIDGYAGRQTFTYVYGESSYFGYETEQPGERHSLIPFIDAFYRWISLNPLIQKIPVVHLALSPGALLWALLYLMGYMCHEEHRLDALPYLLPLLVVCTCLLGPMSLVRYVYYLWVFVPVIVLEIYIKRWYIVEP